MPVAVPHGREIYTMTEGFRLTDTRASHQRGHDRESTVRGDLDTRLVDAWLVRAVGQRLLLSTRQALLAVVPGTVLA